MMKYNMNEVGKGIVLIRVYKRLLKALFDTLQFYLD